MKLYCIVNSNYEILFEKYFKGTMQDDFEIIPLQTTSTDKLEIYLEKSDLFIKIAKDNQNSICAFSDVDVQFFGPIRTILENSLKNNDISVMQNYVGAGYTHVNSGLLAMKCNETTLKFMEGVAKTAYQNQVGDDVAMSYGLTKYHKFIKAAILGNKFWCGHQGLPEHPILFHHATGTSVLEEKIKQLDLFKNPPPPAELEIEYEEIETEESEITESDVIEEIEIKNHYPVNTIKFI